AGKDRDDGERDGEVGERRHRPLEFLRVAELVQQGAVLVGMVGGGLLVGDIHRAPLERYTARPLDPPKVAPAPRGVKTRSRSTSKATGSVARRLPTCSRRPCA